MSLSPLVKQLVEALRILPGVGPKSAGRMAFHLLQRDRDGGLRLATLLENAMQQVGHCQRCRTLSEQTICPLCANPNRDKSILCIVESPAEVMAIENTGGYQGLYFVLSGHLSPIDGVGPEEIGIVELSERIQDPHIQEVILATGATVEGEATAYYIADLVKAKQIRVSRIAHGIPMGGELEYVDGGTLAKALTDRAVIE